jgi:pimeloyl-ACP methyl ester carboxylesterase
LFLVISFLWWVLLLVSIFISPPAMNSRGSGFFDFSYTTLAVGNLLVALLFFATPSKAQRIASIAIAVLLLVDMIMILAISRIRAEEGWVGIVSVVWAFLIAAWTVVTDRVVAWGKREEEERLTGREESRRTLVEWLSVLISSILMVVLILVVILLTATLILRARDASLPPPGEKYSVDGNKYQVHVFCHGPTHDSEGTRNPTVFFEGGEAPVEAGLVPFAENALANGTISRYCYWDRPGIAWSDNAPSPMSAGMAADALSEALARAGEQGPWVLVSAGVGGVYSRVFASRHVKDIQGFLLIDTLHEDLLHRIGSPGRGFLLWAYGIISPLGLDRIAGAILKGRTREDRIYGQSSSQGGKFIKAKLQENLVANSLTKNEVVSARRIQSPKTPVVVVSSGIECRKDSEWERKQEDLSKLTSNLLAWDVVNKAPHEVWETYDGRQAIEMRLGQLV